ncbi:MAG: branched-chain amino acid ABC transporter substrate-binding protein [Chloroflexi bacterium AL-W]|nr:branched-chain amino acid ABC transporter substrate-binding protein [Chloroflexi bacterium AL-N1]NOK64744.1 branched-chain amino acid ABC transporter substrate-binding protein [Chloroflexi bacterium AL-N10]NOK75985.1 branched-chain amino acid ABC transporter substrate-binding protein [Chloroflexi bacterium AL-N5]NOK80256.1 branched-chain amino acid ABC transporter substrate-binding protein [Chloroflexi bacterium AL-W]NOK86769.1 branched-chain amino acid ABC transporter substrate-binding prot
MGAYTAGLLASRATIEGEAASGEPIKIGATFDLTGATADVGAPYSEGLLTYIDWKNDQGGIDGRPLELIHDDYAYEVPRAEERYSQYVTQDEVVAFAGWGTGDTEALKETISADQIPFISASYSKNLADPAETPYNFLVGTTYSDQLIIAQTWALEDWAAQDNTDVPRFAYLVNDSPFGTSPLPAGVAHAEKNGLETPLEVPSPRGATDLTPQLTQISEYGAMCFYKTSPVQRHSRCGTPALWDWMGSLFA